LSTGVLLAALVASGACAGGDPGTTPSEDRVITPDPGTIHVRPGETGTARFVLTSGGVPIAAQPVSFTIVDNPDIPGVEAMGATLVDSSAVTDVSGVAAVEVRAGVATEFRVRATAGNEQAELVVNVAPGDTGSVLVVPFFAPNSNAAEPTTGIEVLFFDDTACAGINLANPPLPIRPPVSLPKSGGTASFAEVSISSSGAAVGRALNARGVAIALGCVDLPGASLLADGVVSVTLPLYDAVPSPIGSYTVMTTLDFVPPLAAAAAIASAWRDLSDCPLDPAQLFLDCTIDALSPATAADPLDCKPNPAAGAEGGALGDALAARRGKPIVDLTLAVTACRGAASDDLGTPSLEAIAMGLFGSPTPALVVALPAIGNDAAHVLDHVRLVSKLDVQSGGRPEEYLVTHTLVDAGFTSSVDPYGAEVMLTSLALPSLSAYTPAVTRDGLLVVANHGFSLRLGRVARAGFGAAALAPRDVSPDAGGLIAALAALARSDGTASGCAAFDRALCTAVGRAEGCLATACPAGLSALAARLDAVFDAADGAGLDFYLAGSATLVDTHNDGSANQLGDPNDPAARASWSVDLRTAAGHTRLAAEFSGLRN
jgi:hypothetical protein